MKLLILGATGGIGLELVRQAIDGGHQVTTFVRTAERLKEFVDRMAVIQGDVLNSAELERALEGQDAVLSGFGAREPRSKAGADLPTALRGRADESNVARQNSTWDSRVRCVLVHGFNHPSDVPFRPIVLPGRSYRCFWDGGYLPEERP